MDQVTYGRLKRLEATKGHGPAEKTFRVYYGWAKLNKMQKREALTVAFENQAGAGQQTQRSHKTLHKLMYVACERIQTTEEATDAQHASRAFSIWNIFMDDARIRGSLEAALGENRKADERLVPPDILDDIESRLRESWNELHPGYREPERQLEIRFCD